MSEYAILSEGKRQLCNSLNLISIFNAGYAYRTLRVGANAGGGGGG